MSFSENCEFRRKIFNFCLIKEEKEEEEEEEIFVLYTLYSV